VVGSTVVGNMPGSDVARADRFVGRERELQQVDRLGAAAAAGQGSVVVVSGAPGIGKSRLCDEILTQARRAGLRTMLARCWVGGGAPPLWPWQPILRELCDAETAELLAEGDPGHDHVDPDRFARFVAVTDRLAEACTGSPTCLVVDDVHAADPGALLLVRFLTRSLHRLPLLLVLTRRVEEPVDGSHEATLLREIEADATPLVLARFEEAETASFLQIHGLADLEADLAATLHRVTDGNPLFLRRIAALGPPDTADAVPAGLRLAIDEGLRRLDPDAQRLLRWSSVLGTTVSTREAAVVADVHPTEVVAAVDAADPSGIAVRDDAGRFRFTHELVRSALEDGLDSADRLRAHSRAALAIAGSSPTTPAVAGGTAPSRDDGAEAGVDHRQIPVDRLTRWAHHLLAAAPRSTAAAQAAATACQAAAQAMTRNFAYERAEALVSAAVALHGPAVGEPSGQLLVEWAQAALACGQMTEARQRFGHAASVAEQAGDPVVFAQAALGLGGHWLNEHRSPVERSRVLGLQRAALAALPDHQVALRCRLQLRLVAEAVFDGGPQEPVFDALAACRASGDPLALAEALSLTHHTLLTLEHNDRRLPLADELVQVASEAGHGVLGLMGLLWRTTDLFHHGDERALRAMEELRERAEALACQNLLYIVDVMDVMLRLAAGQLTEAEEAATQAYELGTAVGEIDALGYFSAQMMVLLWLQGREAEIVDVAEEIATSPTLIRAEFSVRAGAALLAVRAGRAEQARANLDRLAAGGLAALPQSSTWGPGMVAIVEVASELGDADVARQAYDLLLPFADLPIVASVGVVCLGSAERSLGIAARTFGQVDLAVEHLERAVEANRRRRNLPALTMAESDLAATLRHRSAPGDVERAITVLTNAIDRAETMDMQRRAEAWRQDLASLLRSTPTPVDLAGPAGPSTVRAAASPSPDPGPTATRPEGDRNGTRRVAGPAVRVGHVFKDAGRWTVVLDGQRVRVPDLVGMRYLAELLVRPGQLLTALALASDGTMTGAAPFHEVLDDEARQRYGDRARELSTELAEAEADNDVARAEKLRLELDLLVDELESATGLSGRPRTFADPTERARTAVRKAIKRALDTIDDANPTIADHLRATIVTGTTCAYTPDPRQPVRWATSQPD
jgi:tetratricopeptide (TPR) repeat protein